MGETRSSSLNSLTDILNDLNSAASDSNSEGSGFTKTKNGSGEKFEIRRRFSDFQPTKINNSQAFLTRSLSLNDDNDQVITQFLASFPDDDVFLQGSGVSLR